MRHLLPMNELDSAIRHFFCAAGAPALSVWAKAPVTVVAATASPTRSAISAPVRAILLFPVIASRPPPQSIACGTCREGWCAARFLARTTPSRLRGQIRPLRAEPLLEFRLTAAQALLASPARLVGVASLDRSEDAPVVDHDRFEVG